MAKRYKIWIRHGDKEGWLYRDQNGMDYYTKYSDGNVFKQNEMRKITKELEGRRLSNLEVRPKRYKEVKND